MEIKILFLLYFITGNLIFAVPVNFFGSAEKNWTDRSQKILNLKKNKFEAEKFLKRIF